MHGKERRGHRLRRDRGDDHSGDRRASHHVTMLQRSPTYYITGRNANALTDTLRELDINEEWIHEIIRRKVLFDQAAFTRRCFSEPEAVKTELLSAVRAHLGEDYDVETHFSPKYRPWRQRVAFIPDADLFQEIRSGKASVVTDEIEKFTPSGILTKSGKLIEADIVVTATGFNLNVLGDIDFVIDGEPLNFADTVTYRGAMFVGVPNMAWVFGYFRSSWTLRVDLVGDFVCRLLNHMKDKGLSKVVPSLRPEDGEMPLSPWIDPENFNPGYVMRGGHLLPKQGDKPEWRHAHDYEVDKETLAAADLGDGTLVSGERPSQAPAPTKKRARKRAFLIRNPLRADPLGSPRPDAAKRASALFLGGRFGGRFGRLGAGGFYPLGDAGRLAATIAQIIELGAPHLAAPHDFDRIDHRRIDGKHALDALAIGDLADREVLVEAAAAARNAHALIGLNAGALAFRDLHVDDDRIAGLERRHLRAGQLGRVLSLDLLNDVHW